ncbi:MAG: hypothetical protein R3F62_23485 [Planctomycetota bacterium]
MRGVWIAAALTLTLSAAQAQGTRGLVGGVGHTTTLETAASAAGEAASALEAATTPVERGRAERALQERLGDLRLQVEREGQRALPPLEALASRLESALYAAEDERPELERALAAVHALREQALLGPEQESYVRAPRRLGGVSGGARRAPQSAPETRVGKLEARYAQSRLILDAPQRGAVEVLGELVGLEVCMLQQSQDYPDDPAESEKLTLKLQEGERLFAQLAGVAYQRYRGTLSERPQVALLELCSFLQDAPRVAPRARRQARLLQGAARRVWNAEHLDRELLRRDAGPRLARLYEVAQTWRRAIGEHLDHPLQEELEHLERRIAAVERELDRRG